MPRRFSLSCNRPVPRRNTNPKEWPLQGGGNPAHKSGAIGEKPSFSGVFAARRCLIACMVLSLLLLVPPGVSGASTAFWVSPNGTDKAPGTRQKPFRTLERARDAVRGVNNGRKQGADFVVYLREGIYRLERPIILDRRDSGRNGGEVTYRAAPGEHPVISGATRVLNWSLHDANLGIFRAYVGPRKSRQLYVNGERAVRARTEAYPAGFRPAYKNAPYTGGIEFIPTDLNAKMWRNPAAWTNPQDVEAIIVTQWKMMSVPLCYVVPYPEYVPNALNPLCRTGLIVLVETRLDERQHLPR